MFVLNHRKGNKLISPNGNKSYFHQANHVKYLIATFFWSLYRVNEDLVSSSSFSSFPMVYSNINYRYEEFWFVENKQTDLKWWIAIVFPGFISGVVYWIESVLTRLREKNHWVWIGIRSLTKQVWWKKVMPHIAHIYLNNIF